MADRFEATPVIRREPIASTRACSIASNTARAVSASGSMRRWIAGSWQASRNAIESACPRRIAASFLVMRRGGSGSRARSAVSAGFSAAKATSSSGLAAIARRQLATARLNGSVGASPPLFALPVLEIAMTTQDRATFTVDSGKSRPSERW